MNKEFTSYSHIPDCQWPSDHRRVSQVLTNQHCPVSNRVVTRQDSCSSDIGLYPGVSTWTHFKDSTGQPQSSYGHRERDPLITDATQPDLYGQSSFGIIHKNIPRQRNDYIMLNRCHSEEDTKEEPKTSVNYGLFSINPNINAKQEVSFDNSGKDNTFPARDSNVHNEFQQSSTMHAEFGNPKVSRGLKGENKTSYEPCLQEFHPSSRQPADTYGGEPEAGCLVRPSRDKWSPRTWTASVMFIILLFGHAATHCRLQARVDHLEKELQVLSQVIHKHVQASIDIPNESTKTPNTDSDLYKKSTSEGIGFTDSLLIYREDPTRNVRPDTPQSGYRKVQILHNAQRKIPAADNKMDHLVYFGERFPSRSRWDSDRARGSVTPDLPGHNGIEDEEAWIGAFKFNTQAAGSDRKDGLILSPSAALSRSKREAREINQKEFNKYCEMKVCKKNNNNKVLTTQLPSEQFIGDFYHIYDYNTDFLNKSRDCFHDTSLPTRPYVCKEATIKYPHQDSVLAVYRPVKENAGNKKENTKKKKACGGPLLEISNGTSGDFKVNVPGIYSINVNITIVSDEGGNHSLALFLNGHAVLACPNGGFRCPRTNEPESFKYRICNMHGMLELSVKDLIQIRTLNKDTVVRLENHRQSQLKAVLLHQSPDGNKRGRC